MKLMIQIPCLNEEESLPRTLKDLPKHIDGVDIIEVLVIDDGSVDQTVDVAKKHGVKHFVRFTKCKGLARGFGAGLDACVKAGADIIVNTDADGQYKGEDIPRLIQPILDGHADMVVGNRDIENVKQFSWLKKRLQRLGSSVVRNLAGGSSVKDMTTGFRAYSREAAMKLNIISDYTYTLESIIQAEHKNLAISNIIISTNHVERPSRLFKNIRQYIKRSIVTMVRVYAMFNPFRLFTVMGTFFVFCGIMIGSRFLYAFMMGQASGKIQSLILAAVFLIIGFLVLVVGIIADLISANRKLLEDVLLRVKNIEIQQQMGHEK